jgi:16S rRNA (guanine(1405)-N(7))-methyltransferase
VDPVATVTARLRSAAKYRGVHPDTIAEVVRREGAAAAHDVGDLERRSRARLHRVAALHLLTGRPAALRRAVERADLDDAAHRRAWCRDVLGAHVSTAERLPDLDRFYPALLGLVPPPRTIVDLACALNPFTLPWLRAATGARYVGHDFNATFVDLANAFLARTYPDCSVVHGDVLARPAPLTGDLALLLKTYHCIEDRHPGAGLRLVDGLATDHVVVSFPTRAMNGRTATFARRHVDELTGLAGRRGWTVARATLPTEDLLAISKTGRGFPSADPQHEIAQPGRPSRPVVHPLRHEVPVVVHPPYRVVAHREQHELHVEGSDPPAHAALDVAHDPSRDVGRRQAPRDAGAGAGGVPGEHLGPPRHDQRAE